MKKYLSLVFTFLILYTFSANAQRYNSAVGVRFSSSEAFVGTGVSFKHFVKNSTALEAILAFDPLALGLMLEKHNPTRAEGLDWYYGGGAYVGFEGRNNLGLLGVIGLDYKIPTVPLNVALDWKPELFLIRKVDFEPAAVGVTVRFAF